METANMMGNITSKFETYAASSVDSQLPATWEEMEGQHCKRLQVLPNSSEYQTVLQKFQYTMPNNNLIRMVRIQNTTLRSQFQAQKRKVEKKIQNVIVTRELFHGTDGDACDKIAQHGFDRSYAGKHGATYGRGIYFAVSAQYSHKFTLSNAQGERSMLLAEVVPGAYCRGNPQMSVAPMQSDGTPFDSVVDNVSNPGMYVVFRDASVYPTYLLTYN